MTYSHQSTSFLGKIDPKGLYLQAHLFGSVVNHVFLSSKAVAVFIWPLNWTCAFGHKCIVVNKPIVPSVISFSILTNRFPSEIRRWQRDRHASLAAFVGEARVGTAGHAENGNCHDAHHTLERCEMLLFWWRSGRVLLYIVFVMCKGWREW